MANISDKHLTLLICLITIRTIVLVFVHGVPAIDYLKKNSLKTRAWERPSVETRVFNAFPIVNVSAFVAFEEERVNRLQYGDLAILNTTLGPNSDFIIQFRRAPRDIMLSLFTDFGFMEGELTSSMDVLVVIGRDSDRPDRPKHRLITSDRRHIDAGSTKLYLYNAVWNRDELEDSPGLSFYGLYLRVNFDGSESESITQLAVNVPRNEGREINLEPNIPMEIKAFYQIVRSVSEFQLASAVASLKSYQAAPGNRKYIVAYGDYTASDVAVKSGMIAQPQMKVLEKENVSSAPETGSSSLLIQVITTTSMLMIMYI